MQAGGRSFQFSDVGTGILVTQEGREPITLTPAQGLPVDRLDNLFGLDEQTILGYGGCNNQRTQVIFTVDARTLDIRLWRRSYGELPLACLYFVWRHGDRVLGATSRGVYSDLLNRRKFVPHYFGWNGMGGWRERSESCYRTDSPAGRLLVKLSTENLTVISENGQPLRTWHAQRRRRLGLEGLQLDHFIDPGNVPCVQRGAPIIEMWAHSYDGRCLFFKPSGWMGEKRRWCYDPVDNMWYGPFVTERVQKLSEITAGLGIWGNREFISTADVKAAAAKAGWALSSAELLRRRDAYIDTQDPVMRAKMLIAFV